MAVKHAEFPHIPGGLHETLSLQRQMRHPLISCKTVARIGRYCVKMSLREMNRPADTDTGGCLPREQPSLLPRDRSLHIFRMAMCPASPLRSLKSGDHGAVLAKES